MTDVLEFPLINGVRHAHSSISLRFQPSGGEANGFSEVKIFCKSISYKRTRERGEVRANHPDPIAHTLGENSYEADIEIYRAEFHVLLSAFGEGYGDIPFTLFVTWGCNGFDTVTDEIRGCHLDSSESGSSQGTDPSVVKIDLGPLKILFGGAEDLAIPLATAATGAAA